MIAIKISDIQLIVDLYFKNIKTEEIETKLKALRRKNEWEKKYIKELLDNGIEKIICLTPSDLTKTKKKFDNIKKPPKRPKKKCNNGADNKECKQLICTLCNRKKEFDEFVSFKEKIIDILGYAKLRSDLYPMYFSKIGIKSCVYCNSQLTITAEEEIDSSSNRQRRTIAKFQVEHFLPKSQYPCFSISFFNLFPVCAYCNNTKSNQHLEFELYSEDTNDEITSSYKFQLTDESIAKYLNNPHIELLKIDFVDNFKYLKTNSKKINEMLDIRGIYNTQIDLIEELIIRKLKYNESYKKILVENFPSIMNFDQIEKRVVLGSYTESNEIHKRPMSKFIQDINDDLEEYISKL